MVVWFFLGHAYFQLNCAWVAGFLVFHTHSFQHNFQHFSLINPRATIVGILVCLYIEIIEFDMVCHIVDIHKKKHPQLLNRNSHGS